MGVAVQQTGIADTLFNVFLMGAVGVGAQYLGPFLDP